MTAEMVASIAGESEENRAQREQLTKQLDVLMKGFETCKRFMTIGVLGMTLPFSSLADCHSRT